LGIDKCDYAQTKPDHTFSGACFAISTTYIEEQTQFPFHESINLLSSIPVAERQDPDFLIGPGNKKPRKKGSAVTTLLQPFEITNWHF
jgi:hypothetical protein